MDISPWGGSRLTSAAVRFCLIFDEILARLLDNKGVTDQRLGLRVAGIIFAVFFLGHLLRIVAQAEIIIAGHKVPMWPSWLAIVVAGFLSAWLWSLSKRR